MRREAVEFAYRQHVRGKSVDDILTSLAHKYPTDDAMTSVSLIQALYAYAAELNKARDEHALAMSTMSTRDRLQFLFGKALDTAEDLLGADDPKLVNAGVSALKAAQAAALSAHQVEVENHKLANGETDEHVVLSGLDSMLALARSVRDEQ